MVNSRKVKSRILELGLTQESIARDMSLDYSTLNLKLNNKRRIYFDEIVRLCEILNITTSRELKDYFGLDFLAIADSCENDTENVRGGA